MAIPHRIPFSFQTPLWVPETIPDTEPQSSRFGNAIKRQKISFRNVTVILVTDNHFLTF
ncbi:hypothetical protein FHS72_000171 [Loktanella ponticola]|uniref:Uncharacterized protein n=1 Tax=Yoonia ponticola TaxID=1524255 RepID=A0A7W9BHD9_9RHOB|nr:hypothetical protein [Yoonia ponticola]